MGIAEVAIGLLQLASALAARAQQTGEMTPDQRTKLSLAAADIFIKHSQPPPPPPGA